MRKNLQQNNLGFFLPPKLYMNKIQNLTFETTQPANRIPSIFRI